MKNEAKQIGKGEDGGKEASLDGSTNQTSDDLVRLPEPGAGTSENEGKND